MKIDRLIGIITYLLQSDKTTAPELAKRFEVSRRTILRDIDTLCRAGIPIQTTQGGDGGICIMPGYKLDKTVLTLDELESIITGLKGIDSISKNSNFENLMMKLSPDKNAVVSLADSIVIDLSSHYKNSLSEKISLIKKAISDGKLITFDYYYNKGEMTRIIEPYLVAFKWTSWYVFGYCTEREDFRLFKLNRLWNLQTTNESFSPRKIPQDKANLDGGFIDDKQMQIRFDKCVKYLLIDSYGPCCFEETDDCLLLTLDYTNKDYIFSWILGFGDKAEILSPQEIREEFAELIKNTAKLYN
jgi:predicted DNA-binding transcriptional regulator YafY